MGEIEVEDRVLVIKRIRARYRLKVRPDQREAAERAHVAHMNYCPVARSLKGAIDIATELVIEEAG